MSSVPAPTRSPLAALLALFARKPQGRTPLPNAGPGQATHLTVQPRTLVCTCRRPAGFGAAWGPSACDCRPR
jgi:hypothetical protein